MPEALQSFSDALAGVVESAGTSVVRVEARRRLPASGIVWSSDGVILTSHHVVRRDESIRVGLPDGKTADAELAGRDPTTDLAVLRADAKGLAVPAWVEPADLRVGHFALALGRPGHTVQATLGIVSALSEGSWRTPAGGHVDRYLQTDVVMYPGFSGGPLVDVSGQFVGMNTSQLVRGVSLSVPSPTLMQVVETLLEHGRIRRGYLGIGAQPARLPEGMAAELEQETGLLLVSVEDDSPAAAGGLTMGDTIVTFDGQPVRHLDDLLSLLGGERVGAEAPVRILRGGELQEVTVVVGEHS